MTREELLKDMPEEIVTDRLILRIPRPGDGVALNEAVLESFDQLTRWMPWAKQRPPVEETESFCREAIANYWNRTSVAYIMTVRANGKVLGSVGFPKIEWSVPWFEIGYWCRTSETGRGFVQEATRALTDLALVRLGAFRVEIRCDDRNERSAKVAERCGFSLEAARSNDCRSNDGELSTTRVYVRCRR